MEQNLTQQLQTQKSLANLLACSQPSERERLLALTKEARSRWTITGRPKQQTPPGDWVIHLILAGRGWGKTRTGAEDVKAFGLNRPESRIAVIAPTFADGRDTCIEGQSGLLSVLPRDKVARWNRSMGELVLTNGTIYRLFSSEEPDRLRGPQHHRVWGDEPSSWKYARETFDMMMFGLRLGDKPQCILTGTPKPTPLIKELVARSDVHLTRGSTYENRENLAPTFLTEIVKRYEGTRLGRQELNAELLEDVEGALWRRQTIEDNRLTHAPVMSRVVTAIDPSATGNASSDEAGVIGAGKGWCTCKGAGAEHYFVLSDRSVRGMPHVWGANAAAMYHELEADRLVAESNNGGEMIRSVIEGVDPSVPVWLVHASRGKLTRAEPISLLYEQGKVHHVGAFPQLEDEMCGWVPGEDSPNRMDALVWALTDLSAGGDGHKRQIQEMLRAKAEEDARKKAEEEAANNEQATPAPTE